MLIYSFSNTDSDKIPVVVDIFQKSAVNQSANVFIRGEDVVFTVHLHDPSNYLKTAAAIDYIWDFRDGNQLVTHRDLTTHTYTSLGKMSVKLVVEAAFPVECPPASATSSPPRTGTELKVPQRQTHTIHSKLFCLEVVRIRQKRNFFSQVFAKTVTCQRDR